MLLYQGIVNTAKPRSKKWRTHIRGSAEFAVASTMILVNDVFVQTDTRLAFGLACVSLFLQASAAYHLFKVQCHDAGVKT